MLPFLCPFVVAATLPAVRLQPATVRWAQLTSTGTVVARVDLAAPELTPPVEPVIVRIPVMRCVPVQFRYGARRVRRTLDNWIDSDQPLTPLRQWYDSGRSHALVSLVYNSLGDALIYNIQRTP